MEIVLIGMGLLIFCSHIFSSLFSKTKIPNVLLLMLIGLIIGPVFGLVQPSDLGKFGSIFTTITLIAILFQSGTSLDLQALGKAIGPALILTLVNFFLILGIGMLCGKVFLGLNYLESLFLGAALGGTSSAVVIPMVAQLKPSEAAGTVLSLESALSDIICLVVAMALLGGMETGSVSVGGIAVNVLTSMLFAVLLGVVVGFIWMFILKKFLVDMKNSMFTSFALAFILYGISESIGINGGMAILSFGLAVANLYRSKIIVDKTFDGNAMEISLSDNEKNFFSEIVFIFQTYFFVYIGISISFHNVYHLAIGLLFTALVFILRYPVASLLGKKKYTKRDVSLIRILGPKGLVAAVLASLPLQRAVASGAAPEVIRSCETIQNTAYAVVLFSIIACSVMVALSEKKYAAAQKAEEALQEDSVEADSVEADSEATVEDAVEAAVEGASQEADSQEADSQASVEATVEGASQAAVAEAAEGAEASEAADAGVASEGADGAPGADTAGTSQES